VTSVFTVTEAPLELEPVTPDPFIESLDGEAAYSGPLRHGPVIAHVMPLPACWAGVPVDSP
jgi:hypothetical protein